MTEISSSQNLRQVDFLASLGREITSPNTASREAMQIYSLKTAEPA
jgi:hypothetical protein